MTAARATVGRGIGALELLVVVAIIVILAAIALPSYQNYALRAKEVFYNGILTPQYSRPAARPELPVLRAGVPTTRRFGMGPRWTASDIPPLQPDPKITDSAVDVPLTVLLACSFCDAPRALQGNLVYEVRRRQSNVIAFSFVPSASTVGDGRLEISVFDDRNGAEYDRIVVDVAVSNASGLEPAEGGALALAPAGGPTAATTEPTADVILDVAADASGAGVVTIKVTPLDAGLRTTLAPLAMDNAGRWRTFKTGVADQQDIERITTRAYGELTALVKQGAFVDWLKRFREGVRLPARPPPAQMGKPPGDAARQAQDALVLSESQRGEVARLFGKYGQNLYAALFEDGDDGNSLAPSSPRWSVRPARHPRIARCACWSAPRASRCRGNTFIQHRCARSIPRVSGACGSASPCSGSIPAGANARPRRTTAAPWYSSSTPLPPTTPSSRPTCRSVSSKRWCRRRW